jgi:hypothetical protein
MTGRHKTQPAHPNTSNPRPKRGEQCEKDLQIGRPRPTEQNEGVGKRSRSNTEVL